MPRNADIPRDTKLEIARCLISNISAAGDDNACLHLSGQALGDAGIGSLVEMLAGNTEIRRLALADNDIREEGGEFLKRLLESNFSLESIDLVSSHKADADTDAKADADAAISKPTLTFCHCAPRTRTMTCQTRSGKKLALWSSEIVGSTRFSCRSVRKS